MSIDQYRNSINAAFNYTTATEHRCWNYLSKLIETLVSDDFTTNESEEILKRITDLKLEIANQVVTLGLTSVSEKEPPGNVCMANNKEVRSEFKETFAPIDNSITSTPFCIRLHTEKNTRNS